MNRIKEGPPSRVTRRRGVRQALTVAALRGLMSLTVLAGSAAPVRAQENPDPNPAALGGALNRLDPATDPIAVVDKTADPQVATEVTPATDGINLTDGGQARTVELNTDSEKPPFPMIPLRWIANPTKEGVLGLTFKPQYKDLSPEEAKKMAESERLKSTEILSQIMFDLSKYGDDIKVVVDKFTRDQAAQRLNPEGYPEYYTLVYFNPSYTQLPEKAREQVLNYTIDFISRDPIKLQIARKFFVNGDKLNDTGSSIDAKREAVLTKLLLDKTISDEVESMLAKGEIFTIILARIGNPAFMNRAESTARLKATEILSKEPTKELASSN